MDDDGDFVNFALLPSMVVAQQSTYFETHGVGGQNFFLTNLFYQ